MTCMETRQVPKFSEQALTLWISVVGTFNLSACDHICINYGFVPLQASAVVSLGVRNFTHSCDISSMLHDTVEWHIT